MAAWIAQQTLALIGDLGLFVLQAVIAVLATGFSLVMSNVGATVLLVPPAERMTMTCHRACSLTCVKAHTHPEC